MSLLRERVQTKTLSLTTNQQVLVDGLPDRETLISQHIAENPQVCIGAYHHRGLTLGNPQHI